MLLALAGCSGVAAPEGWSGGVIAADKLFIGTMEGTLLALDVDSGRKLCEFALPENTDRRDSQAIYGTPALANGTIFVGGYDGVLYSLPVECGGDSDGHWEPDDSEPVGGREPIVGGPVAVDGAVLIGSSDGSLYAFDYDYDLRDFSLRWAFPTGNKVWGAPVVAEGVAYFGSLDHKLYAVDLESGDPAWPAPFEAGGAITATPVLEGGRLYVGAFDSVFYAIDALTGREVERFAAAGSWYWSRAVSSGSTIYAPSLDGNLYALDRDSLEEVWPAPLRTDGAIMGAPVIVGDRIAVPSMDGKLRLLRIEDGSDPRICDIGVKLRAPLYEHDGFIYFGATNHSIRALQVDSRGDPDESWVHFTNEEIPVDPYRDPDC